MRKFIIYSLFWLYLTNFACSQNNRSTKIYGTKGLAKTKEILVGLDLPDWFWGGAHIFENVEKYYSLVDSNLLEEFLAKRPARGLNDPQSILNNEQRKEIEELIAEHNIKSALPLYVNLLSHGQKLSLSEDELQLRIEKLFNNKNSLVVFYYYGFARGVNGYVLLDDVGFIEDWEADELFLKSARDASVEVEDFLEMERFIKDVSKRSYWLEQKLIPPVIVEKSEDDIGTEKKNKGSLDDLLLFLTDHAKSIVFALWILAFGGWYFLWSRKWRKFIIRDGDIPVRLGADHGANVSDSLEFSNPKFSLTEQYEKAKNREL